MVIEEVGILYSVTYHRMLVNVTPALPVRVRGPTSGALQFTASGLQCCLPGDPKTCRFHLELIPCPSRQES